MPRGAAELYFRYQIIIWCSVCYSLTLPKWRPCSSLIKVPATRSPPPSSPQSVLYYYTISTKGACVDVNNNNILFKHRVVMEFWFIVLCDFRYVDRLYGGDGYSGSARLVGLEPIRIQYTLPMYCFHILFEKKELICSCLFVPQSPIDKRVTRRKFWLVPRISMYNVCRYREWKHGRMQSSKYDGQILIIILI